MKTPSPAAEAVTLGEGNTPLIRSERIGPALGLRQLWFKYEGANPTGSYKDRFAAAAVTRLRREGRPACLGTSSGNTGAALAAYCARAGIPCYLAIVEGAPEGKLRQMLAYGAKLYRIRNFGTSPVMSKAVMDGLGGLAAELGAAVEISAFVYSPVGMAGVQSIGTEIAAAFGGAAPHVFSPAGAGGLTLAVARGLAAAGSSARVHCVQPAGNDTIASALRAGRDRAAPVESKTAISGLQVGSILDGDAVIAACRLSGGLGHVVEDEAAWSWQARMATEEGIFCEPAGAVALAGAAQAVARGELPADEPVVCLVTGSGFKDERSLIRMTGGGATPLLDDFQAFREAVKAGVRGAPRN
ncbi:MAG: pyridoxal-phosphate dependent enzyme [Opitutaceae bacterium]|nr:pyridoxal-phosphate dependent enzyme [Opitutaceae bacterium]